MTVYETNSQKKNDRCELLTKLLARSLDPAAPEPEAINSATRFVQIARKDGVTFNRMSEFLSPALPPPPSRPVEPPACAVRMRQGKYKGHDLGWIARNDPIYLAWLVRDFSGDFIRDAAEQVAAYFRGEAA